MKPTFSKQARIQANQMDISVFRFKISILIYYIVLGIDFNL